MQELIFSVVKNSLSITFFVLAMMLFIEYVNVRTQGAFCRKTDCYLYYIDVNRRGKCCLTAATGQHWFVHHVI